MSELVPRGRSRPLTGAPGLVYTAGFRRFLTAGNTLRWNSMFEARRGRRRATLWCIRRVQPARSARGEVSN